MKTNQRSGGLLKWQWRNYPEAHRDRANLVLHLITVPMFIAGTIAILTAPFTSWLAVPAGLMAMVSALGAQGRGHRNEKAIPAKFEGPGDAIARLCVENWITFPRFVISGQLRKQWVESAACAPSSFNTSNTKMQG